MPKVSERRFGVEIEFGSGRLGEGGVVSLLRSNNLGHWVDGREYETSERHGNLHWDGTELEISSPILCGRQGFAELKAVMGLLREHGAYVTSSDGLHVHHDAPEFVSDKTAAERLLDSWVANRKNIERFVAERRARSWACPPWGNTRVQEFKRHPNGQSYYGGRNDLNLSSLAEHGTVEIRLHEGTLDFGIAFPWIKFGQYLLDSVARRKRPMVCFNDPEVLLNRCRIAKGAKQALLKRARESTLDPTYNQDESNTCEDCGWHYDDCACDGW